jgi:uncharacterized protein
MAARGSVTSMVREGQAEKGAKFTDYFEFSEPFTRLPSHRVLALFRGGKRRSPTSPWSPAPDAEYEQRIAERFGIGNQGARRPVAAGHGALGLAHPASCAPERRHGVRLWQAAEDEAVRVFAANVRDLLWPRRIYARTTIGLDPGFRTASRSRSPTAPARRSGTATIYPHEPHRRWDEAIDTLTSLAKQHHAELVAIGNGTASRETDRLAADLIKRHPELKLTKVVVSEAGASVYSASAYA